MKKVRVILGLAAMVSLFLCVGQAHADSISVSTSAPTAVIPATSFGKTTIMMYSAPTVAVYLMSYPESSTQTFVNNGFLVGTSTAPTTLVDYHGDLYAESPKAASAQQLVVIGGQ